MKLLMESWRRFLLENQDSNMLDDLFSTSPFGRKRPAWVSESLDEEEALDAIKQLDENYLRSFLEKFKNNELDVGSLYNTLDEKEKIVLKSIVLFTAGNVASVRDPNEYKPEMANKEIEIDSPGSGRDLKKVKFSAPSQDEYRIANHVMSTIATMRSTYNGTIYRGMAIPSQQFQQNVRVGQQFASKGISSWTTNLDVAELFSFSNSALNKIVPSEEQNVAEIIFIINNPAFGGDISRVSAYPGEFEYILDKPVRIDKIQSPDEEKPYMKKPFIDRYRVICSI